MSERTPETDDIRAAIERSSLGTPEAQALRATVSDEHAARIVARAEEIEQEDVRAVLRRVERLAATWERRGSTPDSAARITGQRFADELRAAMNYPPG